MTVENENCSGFHSSRVLRQRNSPQPKRTTDFYGNGRVHEKTNKFRRYTRNARNCTHTSRFTLCTLGLGGSHNLSFSIRVIHTCTSGNFCVLFRLVARVTSRQMFVKTRRAGKWASIHHLREMIACLNNWIAIWKREKPRVFPLKH